MRKLHRYLTVTKKARKLTISRERLRQILAQEDVTFKKTKTWKESNDPDYDAKCARIEEVINNNPNTPSPLMSSVPWLSAPTQARHGRKRTSLSASQPTTPRRTGPRSSTPATRSATTRCGGVLHRRKSQRAVLRGLKSIRAQRPDGEMIYVILDNLSMHKTPKTKRWCADNNVELCFTPTSTSWANPIECHFGSLREFVLANSYPRSHRALSRALHKHCLWRNENARDPAILEAQRKERARVRSEAGRRWGRATTSRRLNRGSPHR